MVGATLGDIRRYIESLASDAGSFYLVCGRTGERPVPAARLTFDDRSTARAAARATEQYRAALRRYDPNVPFYDIIVCRHPAEGTSVESNRSPLGRSDDREDASSLRTGDGQSAVEFCHTVAGAVFELIAESTHDDLEAAIMDSYFAVAETIESSDDLCLCLLESMAGELDDHLAPAEQLDILLAAAQRLPPRPAGADPLESTLAQLQSAALLDAYTVRPTTDGETGSRSWTVTLDDYALGRSAERVVTLPIVLDLFRRFPTRELSVAAGEPTSRSPRSSGWQIEVTTAPTTDPNGLVSVSHPTRP